MAVYTTITKEQLVDFLGHYDLGVLESFQGIAQGVSNSNYHLYTSKGHYILTLFEPRRVDEDHLPFFLRYATHLADSGIPSARAIEDKKGAVIRLLAERPTAIMSFVDGDHPQISDISARLCAQVGRLTARMHKAGGMFEQMLDNGYGLARCEQWVKDMTERFDEIGFGLGAIVKGELAELKRKWPRDIPAGAIHGDLFPDNVFVKDGTISGVIDFHFACTDFFAYDLAIVINAWCFDEHAAFVQGHYDALVEGYEAERPLSAAECESLPVLLRGAALRFVLSRCEEVLAHKPEDLVAPHEPQDFVRRLRHFQGEDGVRGEIRNG